MSHIQFTDDLVREYLVSRGFSAALKSFDNDVKASKNHGFRVDKIMDILMSSIHNLDLKQLKATWSHLEQHTFSNLEAHQVIAARELGIGLLRRYVVQAASAPDPTSSAGHRNRDKVTEFFETMAPEIHSRPEWRDWFALPFLKTPEDHPTFAVYFSRQWQDMLTVSLHNFIAIVFQCMAMPTLAQYQEESALILQLQQENIDLRSRLEALTGTAALPPELPAAQEVMDDFSVVAHEAATVDNAGSTSISLRSLIRAIGSTSPGTRRRSPGRRSVGGSGRTEFIPTAGLARSVSASRRPTSSPSEPTGDISDSCNGPVLLGQEALAGHRDPVTHCRFNPAGHLLATCDMGGQVRLWSPTPPPARSVCSLKARSAVLSCCWLGSQLLAYGSTTGDVKIYDASKRRYVAELGGDCLPALRDKRVLYLTGASPTSLLCSLTSRAGSSPVRSDLIIYDLKASREECVMSLPAGVSCGSAEFNHNGQLLLCACSDGHVRVYDGRMEGCISDWTAHTGAALTLRLSPDQTHIYTLGADNKFVTWSLTQTGSQLAECAVHERAAGPFLLSRQSPGADPAQQRPYGQLFCLASRQHVLTCGDTGGRLYKLTLGGLEPVLSLGGHVTSVLTCDMSDNVCVTASLDGVVKTSSLLLAG